MTSSVSKPEAPIAAIKPRRETIHNDTRIDDYFWLRERENPDVVTYLEAENAYTSQMMAHTEQLQKQLYTEMRNRIQEEDISVPEKIDDYFYYYRTEEGEQYPIYCRKFGSMEADEEVLLDQNALAEGHDYFTVGVFKVSPDHQLLAYSTDTSGGELYTLYIKDLRSGDLLKDIIEETFYSVEWANDNQTLFYTRLDDSWRPNRLFRHRLGDDPTTDPMIYQEMDEKFRVGLYKTKSQDYLILSIHSAITSENWVISADAPMMAPMVVQPRETGVEYYVEHHGERFLITTNEQAQNFCVMQAPVDHPDKENWREFIPHNPDVKIDQVEPFHNHLVIYKRMGGLRQIEIQNVETGVSHHVKFPEPVYTFYESLNPSFTSNTLRFTYQSLTRPDSIYDYNMSDRTRELLKQKPVLGGYTPDDYVSERLVATASDDAQIPISIVRHKNTGVDTPKPLLLYAYGSYGYSIEPSFNSNRVSLLDRGMIYAIAHIRGGGEMGRPWYDNGKLLNKKNTFTDFMACAEHLVTEGYTTPDQLAAMGGSAGGLLMGAVTNMRPDLFKVIVADVPFVDVINTMLDASIPLTVVEYEEWGNPNDPTYYEYMKSYSPYDNIVAKEYPNIVVTAGLNDPRVQYWEPAKWVAKLRALKTDSNRLALKTNMGAGHGGASGRFDYLKEIAFEYAFILDVLKSED
ncbi:S9 family peptidase [Chloroflexi bacterium TSY]|nr:S9 family peptidase [Chloroflexi bacterium TSY]